MGQGRRRAGEYYRLDDVAHEYESPNRKTFKRPNPAGVKGAVRKGLEAWKFIYAGKAKTVDDVKYAFCKDHGRKDAEGHGGMYMPSPHNHEEWQAVKDEKRTNWKEGRKYLKAVKRKASKIEPELDPDPIPSTSTLTLAKSFKSILTSKVQMSDAEATYLIDIVVADEDENKMAAK